MARAYVETEVDLGSLADEDLRREVLERGKSIIIPGGDISYAGTLADLARRIEVTFNAKVIRTTPGADFSIHAGRDSHNGHGCATIIVLEGV